MSERNLTERLQADERLIEALRLTASPPRAWVEAAALIPATLGDLDAVERVVSSDEFRTRFRASPEAAVRQAGLPATPALLSALRAELA